MTDGKKFLELSRRHFLLAGGACCATLALAPTVSLAYAPTDQRFVFIFLRGGMDGLAAVPPIGDPDYLGAHGALALDKSAGVIALGDSGFGLHPALAPFNDLYQARELTVFHAIASPYRERSHFDAQDTVENGTGEPHGRTDGWLNRALAALQNGGGQGRELGLALGQSVPLIMQGSVAVDSWMPLKLPEAAPDFLDRVHNMYQRDEALDRAYAEMQATDAEAGNADQQSAGNAIQQMAATAGRMLAADNGPRIAVFDVPGWDTHVGQGKEKGRLAQALGNLADAVTTLKQQMAPVWKQTAVLAVTEFGRTVAPNGTGGTDHGTATAAFLAGGSVNGGRVVADWPGLKQSQLYQNRDLAPTKDLRSIFKAALEDHMRVASSSVDGQIFLNSDNIKPLQGLFV